MYARMLHASGKFTSLAALPLAALCCGSPEPDGARFDQRAPERSSGSIEVDGTFIEFASAPATALSGVATLDVTALDRESLPLAYELRYDYATGVVTSDGHGARLDRPGLIALQAAADRLAARLGPSDPALPLHERMLFAAFVLLAESGGMALSTHTFDLKPQSPGLDTTSDKSLGNDGVSCIERGSTYSVSFDFDDTQVVDTPIAADSHSCNGMCGPSCTRLTPFSMWTLDCLEHDSCCSAIGDDTTCWTPLGQCGDEYADAEADFLRGLDPFGRHCDG